ncbi:MAG: HAMP domain-containing histidine kinase [Dysgonamonadaceae bacterium]|nr:HAMP domain-containing histidine kinase [Dysgonamonadaceae bacterium]
MKLHTKIIAAFIFLSLLSVIGYQIYWIKSFYKEQLAKIETDVAIAMRDADYKEISLRIDLVPNFSTYSNFLQIELIRKGIALESFVEKINLEENTIVESTQSNISQRNRFDFRQYVFPFDSEGIYAYRLNLKQPELFVLKQMSGILTGSVLMIVLIIFSYFYLYRIILRQKSLDEIKSDFINNMTHELKTPISVAYAATDALLNYGMMEDPTKRNQYLQISKEQLSRLSSLVEQILTMSVEERKNLKLVPETINLSELFLHLKNQYLLNVDKKIIINIDVEPENIIIEADKIHFPNMIGNLIENAVKYSGESVEINLSAKENNGKITISVKDNGIGIPPASLPKIFDRFYRVSTGNIHNVKGYGLGLHYVKTIVEKHGGKIFVKSKEGVGSEFVIEIKP